MPTHREEPWEQDARRQRERAATRRWPDPVPPARRTPAAAPRPERDAGAWLVASLALVVCAVLAAAALRRGGETSPALPAPAPATAGHVLSLDSHRLPDGGLEAWGRTDAPDGTTVVVRVDGVAGDGWPAVARNGSFYLRTPPAPSAGPQRVTASVER